MAVRAQCVIVCACLVAGVFVGSPSMLQADSTQVAKPDRPTLLRPTLIDETPWPPRTASFPMTDTTHYDYLQFVDSLGLDEENQRSKILRHGLGSVPLQQRVKLVDGGSVLVDSGYVVRLRALQKNPSPGNRQPKHNLVYGTAVIDSTSGAVRFAVTYQVRDSNRADTTHSAEWHFARTLWDWYGQWMLYLSDTFAYERQESHPLVGPIHTTLRVSGRERVAQRDCFVVDQWRGSPGHSGVNRRYWIDVDRRVTVRVCDSGICLERVLPVADSTAGDTVSPVSEPDQSTVTSEKK